MAQDRRLITNRGRLLRSQYGKLVARPVLILPNPETRDSVALGDGASALADAASAITDSLALTDGASANPPTANLAEPITLGDGATFGALVARPQITDSLALTDGAAASVTLGTSSTNTGPYPRLLLSKVGSTYDSTGKAYTTANAGGGQYGVVTGYSIDGNGPTMTDFVMLADGGVFAVQGSNIGVKGGATVGPAGTVYGLSFYVAMSDGSSATRYMQITSV